MENWTDKKMIILLTLLVLLIGGGLIGMSYLKVNGNSKSLLAPYIKKSSDKMIVVWMVHPKNVSTCSVGASIIRDLHKRLDNNVFQVYALNLGMDKKLLRKIEITERINPKNVAITSNKLNKESNILESTNILFLKSRKIILEIKNLKCGMIIGTKKMNDIMRQVSVATK